MNKPIRIVERYGVNHVSVTLQGVQLLSRCSVPELACPIIAPCDKANTEIRTTWQDSSTLIEASAFTSRITPLFCFFTVEIVYAEQRN